MQALKIKEMVWELLKGQSKFELNRDFRTFFEGTHKTIEQRKDQYKDLVTMNKHLINICMNKIITIIPQTNINDVFQKKMNDLERMRDGPKRNNIDFADNIEHNYGNINNLMNQTLAQRQKELEQIQTQFKHKTDEAKQWINVSNKAPKLNIDKLVSKPIETIPVPPKQVSFNLNPSNICLKLNYIENEIAKTMICRLDSNFRLFMSEHGKQSGTIHNILNNIELFQD